jgi:hypothetical protein
LPDTDTCQRNYYQIVKAAWAGLKKALALRRSARFAGIFFGRCFFQPDPKPTADSKNLNTRSSRNWLCMAEVHTM